MGRLESLFLSLIAGWLVLAFAGDGLPSFTPRTPLIAGGGEKVLVIADPEDRKGLASLMLSQTWRKLLVPDDLVITDTTDEPDEANFAAAWQAHKAAAPIVVVEGPKGGETVPFNKDLTPELLRDLCLEKGIE